MSRGNKKNYTRQLLPDTKYGSAVVTKFINNLMSHGKKSVAQRLVYDAFTIIEKKTEQKPLDVFNNAIRNVSPNVRVRSRRIGGANYQVPIEVKKEQKTMFAIKWIIEAVSAKKGRSTAQELAEELMLAAEGQGAAFKRKEDTHRMAESNRAYAHFARF